MNNRDSFPLDDGSFLTSNENAETEVCFQEGVITVKITFLNQNGDTVILNNNVALEWVIDEAVKAGYADQIKERIMQSFDEPFERETPFLS